MDVKIIIPHSKTSSETTTPKRSICSANWFPKALCWGVLKQLFSFLQSDSVIIKFGLIVRSCETETVNQDFAIAFQNILQAICFLRGLVQASGATGQKWMLQDPRHWTRLAISGSANPIFKTIRPLLLFKCSANYQGHMLNLRLPRLAIHLPHTGSEWSQFNALVSSAQDKPTSFHGRGI